MSESERIPQEVIDRCLLPEDAKRFLAENGLPRQLGQYELEPWAIFRKQKQLEPYLYQNNRYYILGDDEYGRVLCARESSGEVVLIDDKHSPALIFFNSGIRQMSLLNDLIVGMTKRAETQTDSAAQRADDEATAARMQEADPAAMSDEAGWWFIAMEEWEWMGKDEWSHDDSA